jgi:hypothetical protein
MLQPHAKYRRQKRARSRSENKQATFDHFVRSQAAGGVKDGQNVAQNWIFSVDTLHVVGSYHDPNVCKVSAPRIPGKPFGKMKTNFTMLGSHKTCERPKW